MITNNPLRHINILVLDDDRIMQQLLHDMLEVVGFENIILAKDGKDALSVMTRQAFDLIICDWKMHPMDGLEFVSYLRTHPDSPDRFVPVIMLTGKGEREDVEMARDAGVTEYLVKPFSATALFARVKAVVESPRNFVISPVYRGPDRRRNQRSLPNGYDRRSGRPTA